MSLIDRVIFAAIGCALWVLILGNLAESPAARAQDAKAPDYHMSQLLHDIVAQAMAGEEPARLEEDDLLEVRLRTILSRTGQIRPQTQGGISKHDIRSVLNACRIVGIVAGHAGRLDARLKC